MGCSGTEDGKAAKRRTRRRRERRWRRAESRRGIWADSHGCIVVGCKGAAGGQVPGEGSPEGQPVCLKWKKTKVQMFLPNVLLVRNVARFIAS